MFFTAVIATASFLIAAVSGEVVSYPRPSIWKKSDYYGLKVNGTDMYTVGYSHYDYVQLSMDEGNPTEFRVYKLDKKDIKLSTISPQKLAIDARVEGNELVFSVKQAHYLILKIDGRHFVIVADPIETDVPDPKGKDVFNVLDFDADDTGGSVTKGIQAAMDEAAKSPGSTVYVPPGLYTIGNLILRNQTSLYLAGGSVLRFTGNPDDYKTLFKKTGLFPGTWWIQTEIDSTDIRVYGRGTIDGNGRKTRDNGYLADLLVPVGTTNFECDGVLVRDSSFWAVTPIQVKEANFTNLKILNRFDVTQDDGFDVMESTKVRVVRAIAISKDDSFSTKTWPDDTGTTKPYPYPSRPLKDVFFDNCLAWTDCYGYKIGQGVYSDQNKVTFQNSVVYQAAVGMGIDHKFGSAAAKNVLFKNMDIEGLHGNAHHRAGWLTVYVQDTGKGVGPIENVYVKNVRARVLGTEGVWLRGVDSSAMVNGVTFSNILVGDSTSAAKTLDELKVVSTEFSKGITIKH